MSKLKTTTTIDLTAADVTEAIRRYIRTEMGVEVGPIRYQMVKECRGFGMSEYNELIFKGANCDAVQP